MYIDKGEIMQINRLFEIIYILLDKKTVTANELAKKFEVSSRTIYRDVEILSGAGIPIYTTKGKGGGISILDNFILDKSVISKEEQSAIITALTAMSVLPNVEKTGIADKMSLLFKSNDSSWIDVDFSDWNVEQKNFFNKIRDSIIERFVLKLKYINSNGEISERIAEPLKLYFKSKSWYLISYCRKADDYRMFRLSRIRDVEVTNEHFEREMCEYKYDNDDENICVNVKLKISKNAEYRVYDEFQDAEKTADCDFIVNMSYPENEWLYGYIMSFGEYAEVLEPTYIRDIIKTKIEKMINNYL